VGRRFARAGLPVAVLARSRATVDTALGALAEAPDQALGLTAHVTDEWALCTALDEAVARLGVPDVIVYNAALIQSDPEPLPDVTSLSLGKAGVRALADLLARAYEPLGIHVATVTVAGTVAPGSAFDPDEIAEEYWRLHAQPAGSWEREVLYSGRFAPAAAAATGQAEAAG
jgi:hypothetical protein